MKRGRPKLHARCSHTVITAKKLQQKTPLLNGDINPLWEVFTEPPNGSLVASTLLGGDSKRVNKRLRHLWMKIPSHMKNSPMFASM
jgi:hypothetical protein